MSAQSHAAKVAKAPCRCCAFLWAFLRGTDGTVELARTGSPTNSKQENYQVSNNGISVDGALG